MRYDDYTKQLLKGCSVLRASEESMNVIRPGQNRSCAKPLVLLRLTLAVLGFAALEVMVYSNAAIGAASSSKDRAALQKFVGVWDVRPMRASRERAGRPSELDGGPIDATQGPDIEGLARGDLRVFQQMTPAGKAAFKAMNPRDLPSNNCRSSGVPTLAVMPNAQSWSVDGDVLTIHHATFDTVRHIYFDGRKVSGPPTQLGYAIGEYSYDVVTIITTNMQASLGALSRNAPGSAARSVIERYRLSSDGQSMDAEITVDDPLYLMHPIVLHAHLVKAPAGTKVEDFPCDVEASQRHLHQNAEQKIP